MDRRVGLSMRLEPKRRAIGNLYGREDAIRSLKCVVCKRPIREREIGLWPMGVQEEYTVSGLCWGCQRNAFNESDLCTCDSPCCEADIGVGVVNCGSQHCIIHGIGVDSHEQ